MDNFIKNLEIKNFKSIKHLTLDCKRVNVFIGKPNVGKSNILEALGLLTNRNYFLDLTGERFFDQTIRYGKIQDLFYDGLTEQNSEYISVKTNLGTALIQYIKRFPEKIFSFYCGILENQDYIPFDFWENKEQIGNWLEIQENGIIIENSIQDEKGDIFNFIQKYDFTGVTDYQSDEPGLIWNGENLYWAIEQIRELRYRIAQFLEEYGLEFVLSKTDKTFIIQKKQDGFVYQYPYSSIADTFQRFIFYLAAIESNSNSVLIFEEPEVHSFPPYVKELAERMILKDDNQYFVSTHSPYLLQTFIDSLDDTQLNVYLTYYKDYQTHVKALTPDELSDIQRFGYDVFFNLKKFEPND